MKKICTVLLLVHSFALHGQLVSIGHFKPDTTISFIIAPTSFDLGSPGFNQKWDFSEVSIYDTSISRTFVPTINTPGFADFPNANLAVTPISKFHAQTEISDKFAFIYQHNTHADYLGTYYVFDGHKSITAFQPPVRISMNSLAYNEQFTFIIDAKTSTNRTGESESSYVRKGTGQWQKDATGKALFPNGNNAIGASRFKNTNEVFDTVIYRPSANESKRYTHETSVSYIISNDNSNEFIRFSYSKGIVTSLQTASNGIVSSSTRMYYDTIIIYTKSITLKEINALATGTDEQQEGLKALVAYPVPSNGVISLNSNQIEFVEIINTKGLLIDRQKYEVSISLPPNSGLYFIKAILPDGRYKILKVIRE